MGTHIKHTSFLSGFPAGFGIVKVSIRYLQSGCKARWLHYLLEGQVFVGIPVCSTDSLIRT